MVLTLCWNACVAQFKAEGRPIKLAAAPYSRRRWLFVEGMVWEALLEGSPPRWFVVEGMAREASLESSPPEGEAPAVVVEEDNPWTDMDEEVTPWTDMDEEVGEMEYSPGSDATAGSPPGISLSWLTPAEFDGMDWLEAAARGHQFEAHFMLAEAAGGAEEQRRLLARRHAMLYGSEWYLMWYILAAWADNGRFPWPAE